MADVAAKSTPRRITIKKRDDFDGYGFNLHAEKGKAGQYVGKVDANSPAEQAGLREGDRILEVNGVDIGAETHKQVVERIKTVPNETTLLVMDPNPVTIKAQANGNTKKSEKEEKKKDDKKKEETKEDETKPEADKSVNNNHTEIIAMENTENINKEKENNTVNTNNNETAKDVSITETEPSPIKEIIETKDASNNNHSTSEMNHSSSNGTTVPKDKIDSDKNGSSTTSSETSGLNLKMTAAELRAKLMAKKKYDPKNESIDLRKKYDIIEKM
jgi:Na(+)/H(+) exchange regulatory cofactor NHE-RF2